MEPVKFSAACLVIAEIGSVHDGSFGNAQKLIDIATQCGADAVKFQTHIAAAESTLAEPWRVKFSQQDPTRYDSWKRMEFTEEQWRGLKKHAGRAGAQIPLFVFLGRGRGFANPDRRCSVESSVW